MNTNHTKKRFQVWKALGNGPYHYVASYQTRRKQNKWLDSIGNKSAQSMANHSRLTFRKGELTWDTLTHSGQRV